MTPYILGPDALQDLHDLWDYSAAENLGAADRVIEALFVAFERLAAMPGLSFARGSDGPAPAVLDGGRVPDHLPGGAHSY